MNLSPNLFLQGNQNTFSIYPIDNSASLEKKQIIYENPRVTQEIAAFLPAKSIQKIIDFSGIIATKKRNPELKKVVEKLTPIYPFSIEGLSDVIASRTLRSLTEENYAARSYILCTAGRDAMRIAENRRMYQERWWDKLQDFQLKVHDEYGVIRTEIKQANRSGYSYEELDSIIMESIQEIDEDSILEKFDDIDQIIGNYRTIEESKIKAEDKEKIERYEEFLDFYTRRTIIQINYLQPILDVCRIADLADKPIFGKLDKIIFRKTERLTDFVKDKDEKTTAYIIQKLLKKVNIPGLTS